MNTDPLLDLSAKLKSSDRLPSSKVLLFLIGSLGDTLVALPSMRALRSHFSGAEIVLLQNIQSGGVVASRDVVPADLVDRHITYISDKSGLSRTQEYWELWRRIRAEQFDSVAYLVLTERSRAAVFRDRLFFKSCGIRKDMGFVSYSAAELYPLDSDGYPARTERESERKLERLIRTGVRADTYEALKQPGIEPSTPEVGKVIAWLAPRRTQGKVLLAMAPGCKTQANDWPSQNFLNLGKRIVSNTLADIVVVGGPQDRELGDSLIRSWGSGMNAAGEFSISESAALLSQCDAYIGPDTGTMHLAAAVNTPCLVIAGSRTNPGQWFPLGDHHTVVQHKVPCAGCHYLTCPVPGHPCTEGITVDLAWAALEEFLSSKPQSLHHIYV